MKLKLLLSSCLVILTSCSKGNYEIMLEAEEGSHLNKDGYYSYTPSIEMSDFSNTYQSALFRFSSLTVNYDEKEYKFRYLRANPEIAKEKIIIVMPGKSNPWLVMMPIANELLNEGYNIIFTDHYGEENGYRAEMEKDWGEKGIEEVGILIGAIKGIEDYKNHDIGFLGSSLGALVGLAAMADNPEIECLVAEGIPVNPRRSAENILDESFWASLFVNLDDYNELLEKYDIKENLKDIELSKSIYLFWGDDDEYYFNEDWKEISTFFQNRFKTGKTMIFNDAKHTNRIGKDISPEKFEEINKSIVEYFNKNL